MLSRLRFSDKTRFVRNPFTLRCAALLLLLALVLSFVGCGETVSPEAIAYKWNTTELKGEESAKNALSYFGFTEAELACADLSSFGLVKSVEFTDTGTFRFFYDKEATKAAFEDFVNGAIAKLFENREDLSEIFGEELAAETTLVSFETAYAAQFDFQSYGEYLDYVVGELLASFDLEHNLIEQGSYSLNGDKIELKAENSTESEFIGFALSGDELTIIYSDAKEVYTKASKD